MAIAYDLCLPRALSQAVGAAPPKPRPTTPAPAPAPPPGVPARGARPLYAAWQGATLPADGAVGVPAALAAALGLRRGAGVALRPLAGVEVAEAVVVEPLRDDDWEVLELNAGHLEGQLLEQVRPQPRNTRAREHAGWVGGLVEKGSRAGRLWAWAWGPWSEGC